MIGRLHGKLLWKQAPHLLLDVQGVGYEVEAPMTTFYELPAAGSEITLLTHLVVREDAHLLFGFASEAERTLFRQLIKVSGIGAKMALAILSGISADAFARCVHDNDIATLIRLPGVGKKTAERLIIEMRDRLAIKVGVAETLGLGGGVITATENNPRNDAISALIALGYKPPEASRMALAIDAAGLTSEEIIRRALQAAVK
ncbi:MAG: Holliday junction branch migration protein RuvA [Gammaproteobacteria bacterium]|nr:Holliday junction branch migration protein RuvA [Gammaproteobacteria bacterium]